MAPSLPVLPKESEEQVALVNAAKRRPWGPNLFHVPNERWGKLEAIRMQAQGVKRGIPDNWLIAPREHIRLPWPGANAGMAMELKRRNATPSDVSADQWYWLKVLADSGLFLVIVCRGAADAIKACDDYWDVDKAVRFADYKLTDRGVLVPIEWQV